MKDTKSKIKKLYIDNEKDNFYINAEYELTDSFGNVYKNCIKHLPLPVFDRASIDRNFCFAKIEEIYVNLGFGNLLCAPETVIETKLIRSTTKKMTIKEIEESLGHKVEIVS